MAWARMDDDFHDHPKVEGLSLAAIGLWTVNLTWAYRHRRTAAIVGFIPEARVRKLAGRHYDLLTRELMTPPPGKEHGLWEPAEGGFIIHNFSRYLPKPRDPEEASASGKKGADKRWQNNGKQDGKQPSGEPSTDMANDGSRASAPASPLPTEPPDGGSSRPTPVPTTSGELVAAPDIGALVGHFIDRCAERPPAEVVSRIGKGVKSLAAEGIETEAIRGGLTIVAERGLNPATLPSAVHEHLNARPRQRVNGQDEILQRAMARARAAEGGAA